LLSLFKLRKFLIKFLNSYNHIQKILKVYLSGMLVFTIFRIILFLTENEKFTNAGNDKFPLALQAFFMGFRFDTVISGYILILPFLIMTSLSFFKRRIPAIDKVLVIYLSVMYSLAFLICSIDIPYFNHFFSRLTVSVFEWIESPAFMFKMIIQTPLYWLYIIPFLVFVFFFIKRLSLIFKENKQTNSHPALFYLKNALVSILFFLVIFLAIRGRIAFKAPIQVGTAYFSNDAFLNQLGLNPVFTFLRSYLDASKPENAFISIYDEKDALKKFREYLNYKTVNSEYPIAREIKNLSGLPQKKFNVVIVIMESMSSSKMGWFGNKKNLTPFLDSISNKSCIFNNYYTAGIHTFNGIFSTLFSYPAIFRQHPMKGSAMKKYNGISSALKNYGYSSVYFTTHDGQFDNAEGFLKLNDFSEVISQDDYPAERIKSTLGVCDDYLFNFSIPYLNNYSKKGDPFLAVYMTASDHQPFIIPDYFKPKSNKDEEKIVEYADWSISRFIKSAQKQNWFKNTIFVFTADHGAVRKAEYDMPLEYHHSPFIIYCPALFPEGQINTSIAGQIDIFPTLMGILNFSYTNNTLGIDLFKEKRPYIYFSADDKYGVLNSDYFLIVRDNGLKSLYKYKSADKTNYYDSLPDISAEMEEYAKVNLQTAQWQIKNNKQFIPERLSSKNSSK